MAITKSPLFWACNFDRKPELQPIKMIYCKTNYCCRSTYSRRTGPYARLRQDTYTKPEVKKWSERLQEFAADLGDCFIYFKHDETGNAANMAAEFSSMLSG